MRLTYPGVSVIENQSFTVFIDPDKTVFTIMELESYNCADLNKEQLADFIKLLQDLHAEMKD